MERNVCDAERFYGKEKVAAQVAQEARRRKRSRAARWVKELHKMPSHILGPRDFWMEFDRQAEALNTAARESYDDDVLCTFVYQRENGYRKFVVAAPERYWWHYEHRPADRRCSYEVIPENDPCRLYLDLEFSRELNAESDGPSMTKTVINVFCAYLLAHWGLPCNRYNVLNLDSSTPSKFSRHLIFNLKHAAFKDNYHVGRLVKSICYDILDYLSRDQSRHPHHILDHQKRAMLERLIVETNRGKRLFIDTAVYTKNRHFRIYKSTKWGKHSNLVVSADCEYIPSRTTHDPELNLFLDSLVAYFPTTKDLILLEWPKNGVADATSSRATDPRPVDHAREQEDTRSNYPMLDRHINTLIAPGRIRACRHFESSRVLVFETSGYRYCENVQRRHKSNNVFWVVDLRGKTMYQKCHDIDCSGFKSTPRPLPDEVSFQIDNEGDDVLLNCDAGI